MRSLEELNALSLEFNQKAEQPKTEEQDFSNAVLWVINAVLEDKYGLRMLKEFDSAVRATLFSVMDAEEEVPPALQELAEYQQFKAWKAFNRAVESVSRSRMED